MQTNPVVSGLFKAAIAGLLFAAATASAAGYPAPSGWSSAFRRAAAPTSWRGRSRSGWGNP